MGFKPHTHMSEAQGWFCMLRLSNAPTVVSNVMVGLAIAIQAQSSMRADTMNAPRLDFLYPLVIVTFALLLVYFAGMILNDAFDAKHDRELSLARPIPLGVIQAKDAWFSGSFMLACGVLVSSLLNPASLVMMILLVGGVLTYTFLHRRLLPAIGLMGLCRGLVCVVVLNALREPPPFELIVVCSLSIAMYAALLTYIGRFEHESRSKHSWIVWCMLLPAVVPAVMYGETLDFVWFPLIAYIGWIVLAWRDFTPAVHRIQAGMHKLLAGFCLLDCVLIASIDELSILIVSAICFVFTVAGHRAISGT